jgi:hypothetical protein
MALPKPLLCCSHARAYPQVQRLLLNLPTYSGIIDVTARKDVRVTSPADIPTTPWRPHEPARIPALRAAMAAQMRTPFEISRTAHVIARRRASIVRPAGDPEEAARILCEQEYERLTSAQLYAVTAEMTRLAVVAGESLPDFHLEPEDVPAPTGFMVFDQPIGSYINTSGSTPERFPIVAVSWDSTATPALPAAACGSLSTHRATSMRPNVTPSP